MSITPSNSPVKGNDVTMSCETSPAGVGTSYKFSLNGNTIKSGSSSTYTINNVQIIHDGVYTCEVTNEFNTRSTTVDVDIRCKLL